MNQSNGKAVMTFRPPLIDLTGLFITCDEASLVIAGKDMQGWELILLYDFHDLYKYQKITLLGWQISDFSIVSIKGHPVNTSLFITGGKENIWYWKVK